MWSSGGPFVSRVEQCTHADNAMQYIEKEKERQGLHS